MLDLGAGTFDVTILQMNNSVFQVISTSGDTNLGGKDMDDAVLDYLVNEIEEKHGVNFRGDTKNLNRLRDAGEMAKILLSRKRLTTVKPLLDLDGSRFSPCITLTRKKLEELIKPQLERLQYPLEQALKDSAMGPQDIDKLILVGGPTRIPIVREYFKNYFKVEPEIGIDPMGIVATGASVQASVLNGEIKDTLLLDVTPLSLGVETSGGVFTRLIKRNTTIPVEENMMFATQEDNQSSMMIHVLQGEREMAKDNISVGLFKLDDIPLAPRYEQKVEVTFKIDADGILKVSAEILETGKTEIVTVAETKVLSEEEITKMIIEATKCNEIDEAAKEVVETRNQAEAAVYAAEKSIGKLNAKISEMDKRALEEALEKLRVALNGCRLQKIKACTDELLRLIEEANTKFKKLSQAKTLLSSVERKIGGNLSIENRRELREAVKRLEEAPYKHVSEEVFKLKEMATLLEADYGER